jgi:hypothetical protein
MLAGSRLKSASECPDRAIQRVAPEIWIGDVLGSNLAERPREIRVGVEVLFFKEALIVRR